jgi:hypothetical protein
VVSPWATMTFLTKVARFSFSRTSSVAALTCTG